jgi:soluble lytic murein transglycosylase-like protein
MPEASAGAAQAAMGCYPPTRHYSVSLPATRSQHGQESRMVRTALIGAALLWGALSATARADIYAFTDSRGVTHFSNVPVDQRYELLLQTPEGTSQSGAALRADQLSRSAIYEPFILAAASETQLEPALLRAVILVESGFNETAVSKKGAQGLMQLMPETAEHYGASDAFDPAQNILAGARYLRDLTERYDSNLQLVLAAYNAGEGAVERHGRRIPPFKETQHYVPRVMRVYLRLLTRRG